MMDKKGYSIPVLHKSERKNIKKKLRRETSFHFHTNKTKTSVKSYVLRSNIFSGENCKSLKCPTSKLQIFEIQSSQ